MGKFGENQSIVRNINQKLVIDLLRKQEYSVTDLAIKLQLSNTAITKIINELMALNIVLESDKVVSKVAGRRKVNYKFNEKFGIVAVVNYAKKEILIGDMLGNELACKALENVVKINLAYIDNSIKILKKMLNDFSEYELLSICIATIGKINPNTKDFIYAINIENYKDINLYNIFKQQFDSTVVIQNDIALGLKGEQKKGKLTSNYHNGLYVYIGQSIASALIIDGKLYEGSRGFTGEIGLFTGEGYKQLEQVVSYDALLKRFNEKNMNMTLNQIVQEYKNGNQEVVDIINISAKKLAVVIKNITELLDFEVVVISGMMVQFGTKYLEIIKNYINNYNYLKVDIVYSDLLDKAIAIGAIDEAIVDGINNVLARRK